MQLETLNLQRDLSAVGARFTPLELHLPDDLSLEDWSHLGQKLIRLDQLTKWWLGDWAAYGLEKFDGNPKFTNNPTIQQSNNPSRRGLFKDFAAAAGVNYQTLANLAWVSRSIPPSRRRETLEWSKHAEVAALPAKEQTRWLSLAERNDLPVSALRQQIRLAQGESNALQPDGPVTKYVTRHLDDLLAWLRGRDQDFWTPDRRALWKDRLRPLVDFWQEL